MLEKGGSSASRFRIQRGPNQVKRPPRGRPLGSPCIATAAPRRQSVQPRRLPAARGALTAALAATYGPPAEGRKKGRLKRALARGRALELV